MELYQIIISILYHIVLKTTLVRSKDQKKNV